MKLYLPIIAALMVLSATGARSQTIDSVPGCTVAVACSVGSLSITGGIPASATQGALSVGTLTFSDTGLAQSLQGSSTGYLQTILQNTNIGAGASADYIVANNISTSTTTFGDFGINSSNFTGTGSFSLPNATYLYGAGGDLVLGTTTANNIHFTVNNGASDVILISSAGVLSLGSALPVSSGGTGVTIATGTGSTVLSNNPVLVTPAIGAATGTSFVASSFIQAPSVFAGGYFATTNSSYIGLGAATDLILNWRGAANLGIGASSATPIAQTISAPAVIAGTSNTGGANLTFDASRGTGTGAGGSLIFRVAPSGTTGTAQNSLVTALTIDSTKNITFGAGIISGGSAPTLTGTCTTASQVGGNTAGKFTATCTAQTVIMTFSTATPNGWDCTANDNSTPADTLKQTSFTTTSCTLTGTTVATDIITFHAVGF